MGCETQPLIKRMMENFRWMSEVVKWPCHEDRASPGECLLQTAEMEISAQTRFKLGCNYYYYYYYYYYHTHLYCTVRWCTKYCIALYSTILYGTTLHCTVLHCTVQWHTVLYFTVQYSTVQWCTVQYKTVPTTPTGAAIYCPVVQFCHRPVPNQTQSPVPTLHVVWYSTVMYCNVQYKDVLYCTVQ